LLETQCNYANDKCCLVGITYDANFSDISKIQLEVTETAVVIGQFELTEQNQS